MFDFGAHLKELRKSKNLTQKQLATAIGASERGIQQYELGERKPTFDNLVALAKCFDIPLDELTGRDFNEEQTSIAIAIGQNIRRERQKQNLSLETLSHKTNLSVSQLYSIERGRQNITVNTLSRLAQALHVPISTLLIEQEETE